MFGGQRRVVPPAGEPRVRSPELIDSTSVELGCPRLAIEYWHGEDHFMERWFKKDAEAFLPAAVTLGSPSDNTTPRCQRVARGRALPLPNPQTAALGAAGRGGLAGARKRLNANSIFQIPPGYQEPLKRGHLHRCLFVGTWLHKTGRLIRADRPGQPEPPGSTQCSMPSTS